MSLEANLNKIIDTALSSNNTIGICYAMQEVGRMNNSLLSRYKYSHCDLSKNEVDILLVNNGYKAGQIMYGGDILDIVNGRMDVVGHIDIYSILSQINDIIINRK